MKKFSLIILSVVSLIIFAQSSYALESILALTPDVNFDDKCYKTQPEYVPAYSTVNKVLKKQYFTAILFFLNYDATENNQVQIDFDIKIVAPDNSIYLDLKNINAIDANPDNLKAVLRSDNVLKICFENEDQFGVYEVIATCLDRVSNKKTVVKQKIELTKLIEIEHYNISFENDENFGNWMSNYYLSPKPLEAINAYIYFANSKLNEDQGVFFSTLNFFINLFNENEFMIPILKKRYITQNLKTKIYIIWLLRYLNYDSTDFFLSLQGQEQKVYLEIANQCH